MSVEVHHRFDGPDDAPALVLSNSLGTDMTMWDPQMPALSERFRVLRYDTRGHGDSPSLDGDYSIEDLGRDVLALLDRVGVERASFCGLSIGGMTGMWVAANAPERIERLALLATAAYLPPRDMWAERTETVRSEGMAPMVESAIGRWLTPEFAESSPEADRLRAMLRATSPEGYAGCCMAIGNMDLRDQLGQITAPALVLVGDDDPATPPDRSREIQQAISDSRLAIVPGARHLVNIEKPDEVTEQLLVHLEAQAPV